ncbi:RNA-dependent RNA polymerase [Blechomonas wendygibsoni narnavirus 1]|uniref:RNA-dependent RNA polymerase n=1 Tax=Blechomonas wendygibsoni narnavirus 1 TaxID=2364201 RepID=UPI000EB6A7FA|nr:RNA-dependent RNA polymerase [Blechomonas wendygibsoni narnavirus 1]AYD61666.1 RNA-dependent RNA polymerase [Blechomonas wendygibsoni narnavirus 1]
MDRAHCVPKRIRELAGLCRGLSIRPSLLRLILIGLDQGIIPWSTVSFAVCSKDETKRMSYAGDIMDAILATMLLIDPDRGPYISRAFVWVCTNLRARGLKSVISDLKGLSLWARVTCLSSERTVQSFSKLSEDWFGKLTREGLCQLGRLARALPKADATTVMERIRDYASAMQEDIGSTQPHVLLRLRAYARHWAYTHQPNSIPVPEPHVSPSASYSSSLKNGGQEAECNALPVPEHEPDLKGIPDERLSTFIGPLRDGIGSAGDNKSRLAYTPLLSLVSSIRKVGWLASAFTAAGPYPLNDGEESSYPPVRLAAIQELGFKVRPVTAHSTPEIIAAQHLRQFLFQSLRQWKVTAPVMLGEKSRAIKEVVAAWEEGDVVYSSDLTSATDLCRQDVHIAVLEEILLQWGFGQQAVHIAHLALGPHYVDARKYGIDGFVQRRGILMGNPLTWSLLNIVNFFCAAEALSPGDGVPHAIRVAERKFRICGDDLIGCVKRSVVDRYEARLKEVGYEPSLPKSFVSEVGGVFAETSFLLDKTVSLKPEDFPELDKPVRMVEKVSVQARFLGDIPSKILLPKPSGLPLALRIGPDCTASLSNLPEGKHRQSRLRTMKRAVGVFYPDLISTLLKAGIDPGAPRGLGGAELPWARGCMLSVSKRAASILAAGNHLRGAAMSHGSILAAALGAPYQPNYREVDDLVLGLLEDSAPIASVGLSEPCTALPGLPVWKVHSGDAEQYLRKECALLESSLRAMGVLPPIPKTQSKSRSVGQVGREVVKLRKRILSTYPNAPISQHPLESLRKAQNFPLVLGPFDPSLQTSIFREGRKFKREVQVLAYPDAPHNRQLLLKVSGFPRELIPNGIWRPLE